MRLKDFYLEKWLNPRVDWKECKYNLGSSCVKAFTVEELIELAGLDMDSFIAEFKKMSLHYGHFFGFDRLLAAISRMYRDVQPGMILTAHGGTGANNLVITELVEPGDNVVALIPNYQQHYSIPESLGAEVRYHVLKAENGYLPDLDELASQIDEKTSLITLSNPNNPTGAYIPEEMLREMGRLAGKVGAYILSDEIYRGLDENYMASIVDVYDKGVAISSSSKVFSMAGSRVGWIVTKDKETHDRFENRRSYDTICDGYFDEWLTAIAFENYEKVLARARAIVGENRAILDAWLPTQPRLSCTNKSYGSTAFVTYDMDIPSYELCDDILYKSGVLVCTGDVFEIPHTFRLGYGFGESEMFSAALENLGAYLSTCKPG
ncbi:aminotransferase class I/II-fold pyridoxal phosphate-dependent enzyme [Ruminococcaceae bacterium OttesenSCG-928-A11]|nr:aminotransferase class I/II-fold pyridoxal phosphate-dependent enzyme [Ruminococcaceae bacterium OttesenSCG-928-A11]